MIHPSPTRVPILTYHQVGEFSAETVRRQRGNYVRAERFRQQVRMLRSFGFQAVTLAQVRDWLAGKSNLPPRAVAFTFDDAYEGIFHHVAPVLREQGWPATTFVVTGEVGGCNTWDLAKGIVPASLMGAEQLRALAESGWEIGGHSRTHPRLAAIDEEGLADEISGSHSDLRALMGEAPASWCYPYGSLDKGVVAAVAKAGYRVAVTLAPGAARASSRPLLLPRVHVGYRVTAPLLLWRILRA